MVLIFVEYVNGEICTLTMPNLKKHIQNQKMNVTTRNFPLKVEDIKKKYKISDGGTLFAFFTTNLKNEKIVLLCTKI